MLLLAQDDQDRCLVWRASNSELSTLRHTGLSETGGGAMVAMNVKYAGTIGSRAY